MGLVSEKQKFCKQKLPEEWKQPLVVIPQQALFLQCIYHVLVAKNL